MNEHDFGFRRRQFQRLQGLIARDFREVDGDHDLVVGVYRLVANDQHGRGTDLEQLARHVAQIFVAVGIFAMRADDEQAGFSGDGFLHDFGGCLPKRTIGSHLIP